MTMYKKPKEGEWIQLFKEGMRFACCDCGLVHNFEFRTKCDNQEVQVTLFKNKRSTGQVRRWRKVRTQKEEKI